MSDRKRITAAHRKGRCDNLEREFKSVREQEHGLNKYGEEEYVMSNYYNSEENLIRDSENLCSLITKRSQLEDETRPGKKVCARQVAPMLPFESELPVVPRPQWAIDAIETN